MKKRMTTLAFRMRRRQDSRQDVLILHVYC